MSQANNINHCRKSLLGRIFWGLFFLAAAAAVALSAFNLISLPLLGGLNLGLIVLSIFLLAITIASLPKLNWFGVFMPLTGITTIVAVNTDYLSLTSDGIGALWTVAVLVAFGFTILFHRRRGFGHSWRETMRHQAGHHGKHTKFDRHNPDKYEDAINEADESEVVVDVNMGATIKYVNAENFQRAELNCRLGAIKAYFDSAKIKGGEATIMVNGFMSGIELYVPKNWRIVDSTNSTMAGMEEKNAPRFADQKDVKTVTLTGDLTMSGIEIIYV